MRVGRIAAVLAVLSGIASSASATPFLFAFTNNHEVVSLVTDQGTFLTSTAQFDAGTNNSGWWSATRAAMDSNDNYFAGSLNAVDVLNDFFTFLAPANLPAITTASLSLPRGSGAHTGDVPLLYSLFDVITDAAILNNNVGTSAAIFNDLGSGTLFGSIVVTDLLLPDPLVVGLNADFIAAFNASRGSYFSIGGTVTPAAVPEPTSLLLLVTGGLALRRKVRA
jgi:hypothetical protein